jgi:hypothetical protein
MANSGTAIKKRITDLTMSFANPGVPRHLFSITSSFLLSVVGGVVERIDEEDLQTWPHPPFELPGQEGSGRGGRPDARFVVM